MGQKAWTHIRVGDRIDSSPPPGVEPVSMTIGPQVLRQAGYLIPSRMYLVRDFTRLHKKPPPLVTVRDYKTRQVLF
ncbi:hypothetical protein DY000_02018147 [Brassica cretica]|uniref:Uncharacterized protein n=1 Tax=Brassica cretica TaxID=69181 RepID=A0ABQ7D1C2_BRACR|nr:hypothetical protein DY000_02018147 [Brassica cretica]